MQIQENPAAEAFSECKFCSEVSKAVGEDPIGTAGTADHWLVMELPQPWTDQVFTENPKIASLIELFKSLILKKGIKLRPLLIAPDKTYSRPDETRIIYYRRPQTHFAKFEKQEYIVPESEDAGLAKAILYQLAGKPNELASYQKYLQPTSHIREVMICTHGNVDAACSRFGYPLYQKLRSEYAMQEHSSIGEKPGLRVWRCSHFGGHRFAPTLIDLPTGQYWGHMTDEKMMQLLERRGDVAELRQNYRGWSGLTNFEQVAERELFQKYGWEWLSYERSGKTIWKGGLTGLQRFVYPLARWIPIKPVQTLLDMWTGKAKWADVEISYLPPNQTELQTYRVRVTAENSVMTAPKSLKNGEAMKLQSLPQYSVVPLD